ncbi:MAG: tRNA (guanosine(37)-N1)-methyltransferase TrmD [Acidobacteria bacterium]|nr:tRNA (guanosine(37)-N1)-methyltransferase TrmD [Acidobacteriota bacterium]
MIFHVLTIFPEFFRGPFEHGVLARAIQTNKIQIRIHDLRQWTFDRHRSVDDRPFGGGEGMLMKPEPIFLAAQTILPDKRTGRSGSAAEPERVLCARDPEKSDNKKIALLSAQGRLFNQATARRWSELDEILLICGRYEGVDERVAEHLVDDEVSIGDFVLSGGELGAALIIDAVARLVPGVLGNEASSENESFSGELLDCPQFTRPADFRGHTVPEVLLGGNHEEIRKWRRSASLAKTARNRPDLLPKI